MRIVPRGLHGQLILLVSCILLATGASSGWLTAHRQSGMLVASMRKHSVVMVQNFSDRCAYFLVLQDFAGLESFLIKSAALPDIRRLQVCEPNGTVVGDVENGPDGKPHSKSAKIHVVPPATRAATSGLEGNELVVWQPVEAGELLGWMKVRFSLSSIRKAQADTLRNSLLLSLFWVSCSIALLLAMLRPLVRAISGLTDFSRNLAEHKGAQTAVGIRAVEIEELAASLNYASNRLYSSEQDLLREQETIKEQYSTLKRADEELRRLNRELRALSSCNEALLRAREENTLLNDICRIVCEEAGYRMVWVGFAEHDDAKTVRPVAWAGVEEGYLANANITWADSRYGRGPTGMAIRSGKSFCCQDFLIDSQTEPWRENALQRGYRSSIALPLTDENNNTFGALMIYSKEPNTFTTDETRLLEELAGDLAFGITALRARHQRIQAEEALRRFTGELEQRVKERTAELENMNEELARLNKLFVGRELKMIELKEKIKALEGQLRE